MDAKRVISYPLSTEKAIRLMESENTLLFVVEKKATKADVKRAIEGTFKAKVVSVNTLIDKSGKKRAYVKLSKDTPAIDVASGLGIM